MRSLEREKSTVEEITLGDLPNWIDPKWVLDYSDRVETPSGRDLQASILANDKETISLSRIIGRALGLPEGVSVYSPTIAPILFRMLSTHNDTQGSDLASPMVVTHKNGDKNYLFWASESVLVEKIIEEERDKLEPYLPFYVTPEEMKLLQEGEEKTEEIVLKRLSYASTSLLVHMGMPEVMVEEVVRSVATHATIWEILLESELPIKTSGHFLKVFRTSLYRRGLNYNRDLNRRQNEKPFTPFGYLGWEELQGFFETNHPDSLEYENLMAILPIKTRLAFVLRGFFGLSYLQITKIVSETFKQPMTVMTSTLSQAKRNLQQRLETPIDLREKIPPVLVVERLAYASPEIIEELLKRVRSKEQREVLRYKYIDRLSNTEMGDRLGKTEGAIKSLLHRAVTKLLAEMAGEGVIDVDELAISSKERQTLLKKRLKPAEEMEWGQHNAIVREFSEKNPDLFLDLLKKLRSKLQKKVLHGIFIEKISTKELAVEMGRSVKAVESHLTNGRVRFLFEMVESGLINEEKILLTPNQKLLFKRKELDHHTAIVREFSEERPDLFLDLLKKLRSYLQRRALHNIFIEKKSVEEAAEEMGRTPRHIDDYIYRGRIKFLVEMIRSELISAEAVVLTSAQKLLLTKSEKDLFPDEIYLNDVEDEIAKKN